MKTSLERFKEKLIVTPDGCWNWTAAKDHKHYGMFYLDGRIVRAHRASWSLHYGDIPDELLVCHSCDNPSCVNPEHMFLGTYKDNNQDCVNKARRTPCKGIANGRSLLTEADVKQIRELAKSHSKQYISSKYPVSRQQISDIVNRKKWRHLL